MGDKAKGRSSGGAGHVSPSPDLKAFAFDPRRRENELEATQERLGHVIAVCPAIIYSTQASGDYSCTFVSENIEQILGYTQREMLDDPDFWTNNLHPQDTRRVLAEMYRLIPEGGGNLEYRFRHHDGHYRWFQDTFKTVFNDLGGAQEIVGSWADITQRKLAESFQTLYQASFALNEPIGLKKWFNGFLRTAQDVLHVDRLTILLADPDGMWLEAVASTETVQALESIRVPIALEGGAIADCFMTRKTIIWDAHGDMPDKFKLRPPYDEIDAFRSHVFAIVPLTVQEQTIGVLAAGWKGTRPFDPATVEPLHMLAAQAAVATEHSRLYAAAQPVLRRSLRLEEVYPAFAAAVKALLAYDRIGVVVPEGDQLVMALSVAEPPLASWQGQAWPRSDGTAGEWVMSERQPRLIRDLHAASGKSFVDDTFMIKEGVRSTVMLPLVAGDEAVGFFFLDNLTPGAYTERDLELLEPVAQQLALAIQNSRLLKELQQRSEELARSVEELKVLGEVGQAVNSSLDLPTVLMTILEHAVALSRTDVGAIYEYNEKSAEFHLRAAHGLDEDLMRTLRADTARLGEGSVGRSAARRTPIAISDLEATTGENPPLAGLLADAGVRAILNVPLLREDRIYGGLSVGRRSPGEFPGQVKELLRNFAIQSVLAIQNARQFHEIEEKGRQLEIASKHKSQFLANMSHELRTPLNAILGYTELILDGIYGDVSKKIREVLMRLDENGRHLLNLINDVLDLSKIEAGSLRLSLSDYSMAEVVRAALNAIEPQATDKGLAIEVHVPDDLPTGWGDERRLTQAILNLAGNAVKFTEAGRIRIECSAANGSYLVSVSDTGPGIADGDQERVFEEFQQVEGSSTRTKGGTGLGLSISKRIVELHGGVIWLESIVGEGSTFRISLPVRVDDPAEAA
jgi:PAS domain S-box-containing protein